MTDPSPPDSPQLRLAFPAGPARYWAPLALLPGGWASGVRIEIDGQGTITAAGAGSPDRVDERLTGPVLPGMPNLHSHAPARALAGLAQWAGGSDDAASWPAMMARLRARLGPEEIEAIAAQLYVELLKQGYTAVGEFHQLHHAPRGKRYQDHAELAERIVAAAGRTGIGLTLLPALQTQGGFGGEPVPEHEKRCQIDPDAVLRLVTTLRQRHGDNPQLRFGAAIRSLSAASPEALAELIAGLQGQDEMAPIHIQAAEQGSEVEACLAWIDQRPVAYLLSETPVDGRWCLVHATHLTEAEARALAASDAVAGLCPSGEASRGGGLFPLRTYLAAEGKLGIGSDGQAVIDPREELRWLEYGQRLVQPARPVAARPHGSSPGTALWTAALEGGAQALGRPVGRLAPGCRADLLVLDPDHPGLADRPPQALLDALVFAPGGSPVRDVMVGGRWVVRAGAHAAEDAIFAAYRRAITRLLADD